MADDIRHDLTPIPLGAFATVPAALSTELLAFGTRRLTADMAHWQALAAARNPAEWFDLQMRFAVATLGDYADEATRLQEAARTALSGSD
jgi:hypothetical protein